MQRTRLAALNGTARREADIERVRVADEMRRNHEPLDPAYRLEIVTGNYPRWGREAEPALLAALPAADHLATFRWLVEGRDLSMLPDRILLPRAADGSGRGLCGRGHALSPAPQPQLRPSRRKSRPASRGCE